MNVELLVKKILGKNEFSLSKDVPLKYIIYKGIIFLCGLSRGIIKGIWIGQKGKRLFIGRNVKFFLKSKIIFGNNVRIEDNTQIDALSYNGVFLNDGVKIGENSKIICTGTLSNLGVGISIGKNSSFSEYTFFGAAGGISIGSDVISGQCVRFHSENHIFSSKDKLIREQGVSRKGIKIGNNVWIGSGVVFLDGSEVGNNCVIAANTVVTKSFGSDIILAGSPAKIVKSRGVFN